MKKIRPFHTALALSLVVGIAYASISYKPSRDDQKRYDRIASDAKDAFKEGRYDEALKKIDELRDWVPEAKKHAEDAKDPKAKAKDPYEGYDFEPKTKTHYRYLAHFDGVKGSIISEEPRSRVILRFTFYADHQVVYTGSASLDFIKADKKTDFFVSCVPHYDLAVIDSIEAIP